MRYLYKIYSPFDGFYPRRIPERLIDGRFLPLLWANYLDALNLSDEVWIVFTGCAKPGVYVQGLVAGLDRDASTVTLRVRNSSTTAPLTDDVTSVALLSAVAQKRRQVFLWPSDRPLREKCDAADCAQRRCLGCEVWKGFPRIDLAHYCTPWALRGETVVPAYWIIPNRCYLYYGNRKPAPWNARVSQMFYAFKVGEARYAFPLAAGIDAALRARGRARFDAIVPIPLSPDKAQSGELDRTVRLATELGRLAGGSVEKYLSLKEPISKRRMLLQGYTPSQFKARYKQLLHVDSGIKKLSRVALLDDVITKGSTLSATIAAIREAHPHIEIVVVAAGQMIVTEVVADQNGPAW